MERILYLGHERVEWQAAAPVGADYLDVRVGAGVFDEAQCYLRGRMPFALIQVTDGFGCVSGDYQAVLIRHFKQRAHGVGVAYVEALGVGVKFAYPDKPASAQRSDFARRKVTPSRIDGAEADYPIRIACA